MLVYEGIKATGNGNDNNGHGIENTDTDMIVQALILTVMAQVLTFWQYWTDTVIITGTDNFAHESESNTHIGGLDK